MADDALTLTLTFAGSQVRWEAEVLGVRQSRFSTPFDESELPAVVRALEVLQYAHYPTIKWSSDTATFTFSIAERTALARYGLWDGDRVHPDAPRLVGRMLFQALVADPVGAAALDVVRSQAQHSGQDLALALRFPPGETALAALPWELLWPDDPAPLLLGGGRLASCTRHLDLPQPIPPPRQRSGPLQILVIVPYAAMPESLREQEQAAREAAWAPLLAAGAATVRVVSPATRRALVEAVQAAPPDIVHYYGHGSYQAGGASLWIDRDDDKADQITVAQLVVLLGRARLVALYACQGARVGAGMGDLRTGLAPALSASGVPLVLGMQLAVRPAAALRASGLVYAALVAGRSIQEAVARARQALFVEEADGASWYVPALYVRSREIGSVYLLAPTKPPAETEPRATEPAPDPAKPAPPAATLGTAARIKRDALRRRLTARSEEYEATAQAIDSALDPATRVRLERAAEALAAEIAQIEEEIAHIERGAPPASSPAGASQVIVATKKSTISGVDMRGGSGAEQRAEAHDGSSIERAKLNASGPSRQHLRADDESEITDVKLDDREDQQ